MNNIHWIWWSHNAYKYVIFLIKIFITKSHSLCSVWSLDIWQLGSLCKKEVNPVAGVEEDRDGGGDYEGALVNLWVRFLVRIIEKMMREFWSRWNYFSPWRQSLSALFFCAGQSGFSMTLEENTVNVYKHPNIFFTLVIVELWN